MEKSEKEAVVLVRCIDCANFNPGFRRGLCYPIQNAWDGEQLQLPHEPHPCCSFNPRLEAAPTFQEQIEDIIVQHNFKFS